jgi:hypothetical protein
MTEQELRNARGMTNAAVPELKLYTFNEFVTQVREKCEGVAKDKGYNSTGVDGKENELYSFIQSMADGDAHAIGEIIYKAVRYSKRGDKDDLVKIAAWAFLIYKYGFSRVKSDTSQK